MRLSLVFGAGVLASAICCVQGGSAQSNDAQIERKGLLPRAAPTDYQAHAQAGAVTIAAEFTGHAVPTAQGGLSTQDYVVVEAGLFGAPGARLRLAAGDFSLRINGKKAPLPAEPYGLVIPTVKDPEWLPPEPPASKSKTGLSTGGEAGASETPRPLPTPFPVLRAIAQRVQKAVLPEGDRPLPQAGILFFEYHGKPQSIHEVELLYAGPAGKATVTLQP